MAATLFYLVRSPSALARAAAEVRAAFPAADNSSDDVEAIVQGPTLNTCTYLRACIDEAMRLSPSVGGILPREVLPGGMEVKVDDGPHGEVTRHHLPPGTVVGVPHYTIHHNPAYYPDPFSYRPERWIAGGQGQGHDEASSKEDGSGSGSVARAQSAFCPFSVGPRGCVGKGLAYIELMVTLARTLAMYDLRPAAEEAGHHPLGEGGRAGAEWGRHRRGEFQLTDQFTSLKDGPLVEFRRRGRGLGV